MSSAFRDTLFGQLVRWGSGHRFLQYEDEKNGFSVDVTSDFDYPVSQPLSHTTLPVDQGSFNKDAFEITVRPCNPEVPSGDHTQDAGSCWYSQHDTEIPHNWSTSKKVFVVTQISVYTFCVYLGSAIFLASIPEIIVKYHVSLFQSTLPISLYVFGYGSGAMLFSPLSEIPSIGRNIPYITSFALFVAFSAGAATSQSFGALLTWRFLQGFMGSPALATAGASFQDIIGISHVTYAFVFWIASATMAPALGPVISTYSVIAKGWRWSLWEIFWLSIPVFLLMFLTLPETSSAKILYDRQTRLNRRFPDHPIHIAPVRPSMAEITHTTLVRPTQIMLRNPAIAFGNLFTCLIYGIYYSFFESLPRVFLTAYSFTYQEVSLTFLSITLGGLLGVLVYLPWAFWWSRNVNKLGPRRPEKSLIPSLFGVCLIPVGLFLFAWTCHPPYHWSICLIGVVIQGVGIFLILQCLSNYILLAYPAHAASLFAGNDLLRSATGAAALMFSHPLYENLGVAKGVTVLASITVFCCGCLFAMFYWGDKLRARARD